MVSPTGSQSPVSLQTEPSLSASSLRSKLLNWLVSGERPSSGKFFGEFSLGVPSPACLSLSSMRLTIGSSRGRLGSANALSDSA